MIEQRAGKGLYRRCMEIRLPADLVRGLRDCSDSARCKPDAVVATALEDFVACALSITTPPPPRPLESMGCVLPMQLANDLRDLCDWNGWQPFFVIEAAVRSHVERSGARSRSERNRQAAATRRAGLLRKPAARRQCP